MKVMFNARVSGLFDVAYTEKTIECSVVILSIRHGFTDLTTSIKYPSLHMLSANNHNFVVEDISKVEIDSEHELIENFDEKRDRYTLTLYEFMNDVMKECKEKL